MSTPTYGVAIDLTNDLDYLDANEDVTANVLSRVGFRTVRGADMSRPLLVPRAGEAAYELRNDAAQYSIGTISAGDPTRIQATFASVTYTLFEGEIDRATQYPEDTRRSVGVVAQGVLTQLVGKKVSTALYSELTTDVAIRHLLDAAGFPAADRALDVGKTTLAWWWLDEEDAFTALLALVNTEGPGATLYESGKVLTFKDRHHRIEDTASTAIQTTFRGTGTEPLHSAPFAYDDGLKNVVNRCTVTVKRREAAALAAIWSLGIDAVLSASEVRTYTIRTSDGDPFTAALDPVAGTDYTLGAGSVSSATLSRTSGGNATLTITAGAGGCTLLGLQVRAQAVDVTNTTTITDTIAATASQTQYGLQTFTLPIRAEITDVFAQAYANWVVDWFKNGRPTVSITVNNGTDSRLTAALARTMSDRIRVIESRSGLDAEFWIDRIEHRARGLMHETTFGAEQAPSTDYFQIDTDALDGAAILAWI